MIQVVPPLTGNFGTIGEVMQQHEKDFAALGFALNQVTWEGSEKLGRYPVFKFLSKRTGMEIHVLFSPAREGRNGGFVATIVKPVNHVLNVKDYLKLHGVEDPMSRFRYREPNTDLHAFAQSFFQMLGGLLRRELAPILRGEAWEDTPTDWQGYK